MIVPVNASSAPTRLEAALGRLDAMASAALIYPRIAIGGGPLTGKSRIAARIPGRDMIATDDFIHVIWGAQPLAIIAECERHSHFVLSGVQVARCLRAGLEVDVVIWCRDRLEPVTFGQRNMAKGIETIFAQWARGTKVPILYP